MGAIGGIGGSIVALALLAGSPVASARAPLRFDLAPLTAAAPANRPAPAIRASSRRSFSAPQPELLGRDRRLIDSRHARAEAISTLGVGLLTSPESIDAAPTTPTADGLPSFKFKKQGPVARDIRRGYRAMGERLAGRVWDEPRGKRIVFDVDGKPGVGVEIPLH